MAVSERCTRMVSFFSSRFFQNGKVAVYHYRTLSCFRKYIPGIYISGREPSEYAVFDFSTLNVVGKTINIVALKNDRKPVRTQRSQGTPLCYRWPSRPGKACRTHSLTNIVLWYLLCLLSLCILVRSSMRSDFI